MTCIDCQNLNIGINIAEKHKHCNRCGCPNTWDFKLQNPLPNSGKNGWWKEVLTGEMHWNRCDEFKKKCSEIFNTIKDTSPVGTQSKLQTSVSSPTPSSVSTPQPQTGTKTETTKQPEPKVDEEFLKIIGVCGEVEKGIYTIAQEIFLTRKTGDVQDIADRLVELYSTRKINERLDKIIQELDRRSGD